MIYFAQETNGSPIRIGCTTNLHFRKSSLAGWVCGGVEFIATIEGAFYRERFLLELFKPLAVYRDWFRSDAIMWRFLIDGPLAGNIGWIPTDDQIARKDMRDRVLALFGTMENAVPGLGYGGIFNLQTAINTRNASSCQLAAKVTLIEMIRGQQLPPYLLDLHTTPRDPVTDDKLHDAKTLGAAA